MIKLKLNQKGIIHHLLPIIIVIGMAVFGVYILVDSHAEIPTPYNIPCSSQSSVPTVSTNGSDLEYPVTSVTDFNTNNSYQPPLGFYNYGNGIRSPRGWMAQNHIVFTKKGLVIQNYPDPYNKYLYGTKTDAPPNKPIPGDVGAGFDLGSPTQSVVDGGFDICFSMSAGNWQNVELLLIAWPSDGHFSEGEIDIFEGNPQTLYMHIHEIAQETQPTCNCKTCQDPRCNAYNGVWPKALATPGPHLIAARWYQTSTGSGAYDFYLDGKLAISVPVGGNVSMVTMPHLLSIGTRDTNVHSKNRSAATIYWVASYGYNQYPS